MDGIKEPPTLSFIRRMIMTHEDDFKLLKLAQEGDSEAFDELIDRYRNHMYNVARKVVRNHHDANDAVQAALIYAWNTCDKFKFRTEGSVRGWLNTITVGKSISIIRHYNSLASPLYFDIYEGSPYYRSDDNSPSDSIEASEAEEFVKSTLTEIINEVLDDSQKEVAILYFVLEKSYDELVDITGMTKKAIYGRIYRARRRIKVHVQKLKDVEIFEDFIK